MRYSKELRGAINSFRAVETLVSLLADKRSTIRRLNADVLNHVVELAFPGQCALVHSSVSRRLLVWKGRNSACTSTWKHGHPFQLYIRKRPLSEAETSQNIYDVVNTDIDGCEKSVIVHDGQLARNGRRLTMTHRHYAFSRVLGADTTTLDFCHIGVDPLIHNALSGLSSTLLCYGQTGTGKTYTLVGALDYTAGRLAGSDVEIIFYEVHNNKCLDLLNNRRQIYLRSDEHDVVNVRGAHAIELKSCSCSSVKEVFDRAMKLRSSEETERNPISSRSHAVCVVRVLPSETATVSDAEVNCGSITFVDLAGSERNYETSSMTAAKHKESADINFSLMALKNCFRAYHDQLQTLISSHDHITSESTKLSRVHKRKKKSDNRGGAREPGKANYRASLLTRILKECFMLPTEAELDSGRYHRTSIVATVSPAAVDAQHTVNTLNHISLMDPSLQKFISEIATEVPKRGAALTSTPMAQWSSEEVNTWLSTVERGRFAYLAVPPQFTGADLLRLDASSLSNFFAGQMRQARSGNEGEAWTVEGEGRRHLAVSRALWSVIRREIEMSKTDFF